MHEQEFLASHRSAIQSDLYKLENALSEEEFLKAAESVGGSVKRFATALSEAGDERQIDKLSEIYSTVLSSGFESKVKKRALEILTAETVGVFQARLSEEGLLSVFQILADTEERFTLYGQDFPLVGTSLVTRIELTPKTIEELARITSEVSNPQLRQDLIATLAERINGDKDKYAAAALFIKEELDAFQEQIRQYRLNSRISDVEISHFPRSLFSLLKYIRENPDNDLIVDLEHHVLGGEEQVFESSVGFTINKLPTQPLFLWSVEDNAPRFFVIERIDLFPGLEELPDSNLSYPIIGHTRDDMPYLDFSITTYAFWKDKASELPEKLRIKRLHCSEITEQVKEGLKSSDKEEARFYKRIFLASLTRNFGFMPLKLS